MSQELLEERVGNLEENVGKLRTEFAVMSRDLGELKGIQTELKNQNSTILQGLHDIKQQNATRPQPVNWRIAVGTCVAIVAGIGAIATAVWWFISVSPAVQEMRDQVKDMSRALKQHSEFIETWQREGRLLFLDDRVRRLEQAVPWAPKITNAKP